MCRDLNAPGLLNLKTQTGNAHALMASLKKYAYGGGEFPLGGELIPGATLLEACLREESVTSYDPKTSRAERVSGSM